MPREQKSSQAPAEATETSGVLGETTLDSTDILKPAACGTVQGRWVVRGLPHEHGFLSRRQLTVPHSLPWQVHPDPAHRGEQRQKPSSPPQTPWELHTSFLQLPPQAGGRLEGGWREGGGVPRAPLWREQGAQVSETVPATASETWSLESRALLGPHVLTLAATPSPSPPASLPSWGLESQALRTVGAQGLQGAFPPLSGHFSTSLPSPGARGDSCVGDGITWGSLVSRCGLPHDAGEGASLRPRGHLPAGAAPCSQCHAGEQSWRRAVLHPPQGEHAQVRIPGRHRHGPEQGYRGPQGLQA